MKTIKLLIKLLLILMLTLLLTMCSQKVRKYYSEPSIQEDSIGYVIEEIEPIEEEIIIIEHVTKSEPPSSDLELPEIGSLEGIEGEGDMGYLEEEEEEFFIFSGQDGDMGYLEMPVAAGEKGTLVYDMDTAFYYNIVARVKAKISSKYHVEITPEIVSEFNPVEEDLEDGERLELENIITSEVMDMKLDEITPNTFQITRLSSNDQTVEEGWTTWEWSVLPLQPGKFNLRLRAIVKDENDHSNDIVVFDKEIDVKVQNKASWYLELFNNSLDLLQGYWFVLSVLIIPLIMWIRKKYFKKKD